MNFLRKHYPRIKALWMDDFPNHPIIAAIFFGTTVLMITTSFFVIMFALWMAILRKIGWL